MSEAIRNHFPDTVSRMIKMWMPRRDCRTEVSTMSTRSRKGESIITTTQ